MRVLVHDYSGHPFQAQLSRELAQRGHHVVHSWCDAHVSGRGRLAASPGERRIVFEPVAVGEKIDKLSFRKRLVQELRYAFHVARQAKRHHPDVVLLSNVPIPMLVVVVCYLAARRMPWVLWQQDIQGVAIGAFAGDKLHRAFHLVAWVAALGERWSARRAAGIVVIAESFMRVHRQWGTMDKTVVIPNWAPIDEIRPVPRANDWAREQGMDETPTLAYAGTLGLKHNPALLVKLARRIMDDGHQVHLTVVSEGPAMDVLRDEAARLDVRISLLPFQPYDRLSEVLGAGDVLVVLLDHSAGEFSVPSKTLSYLCAGRPILGLMPTDNPAAGLLTRVDGCVLPPDEESLAEAAAWVGSVLSDPDKQADLSHRARRLAEQEFALEACADRFEELLDSVTSNQVSTGSRARMPSR